MCCIRYGDRAVRVDRRAKSWARIKANLPTVGSTKSRCTEGQRDDSRRTAVLWILDHLEPIQEHAAAQSITTDAKLFTPPPYAMYRGPRAIAPSSGAISSSSARTRRRPRSFRGLTSGKSAT
jgi:hypothetical protein